MRIAGIAAIRHVLRELFAKKIEKYHNIVLKLCFRAYFPFALTHSSHSARINITLAKIFDGDRLLAACVHLFHSKNKETCLQKGMIPTQKVCR